MTSTNPIVAFKHVPNNDWGAGLGPIWKDGTISQVTWTKLAYIYGIQTAKFPDTSTIAKAVIHYNNKTSQFCGLELLDQRGLHIAKCGNVNFKKTPRVQVTIEAGQTIVGLKSKIKYPGEGAMCYDLQFIVEQVEV